MNSCSMWSLNLHQGSVPEECCTSQHHRNKKVLWVDELDCKSQDLPDMWCVLTGQRGHHIGRVAEC